MSKFLKRQNLGRMVSVALVVVALTLISATRAQAATETVIHAFNGLPKGGNYPLAGLIFDAGGNLYGTTFAGGGQVVVAPTVVGRSSNCLQAQTVIGRKLSFMRSKAAKMEQIRRAI
jgi:hypothetical protein